MSMDAAAIILAITTAAGVLLQGVDIPHELQDQAQLAVDSMHESAPETQHRVDAAIAGLPPGAREQALEMLNGVGEAVADATNPIISPELRVDEVNPLDGSEESVAPAGRLEGVPLTPDPGYGSAPTTPAPPYLTPGGGGLTAPGAGLPSLAGLGGLAGLIPAVPAAYAGEVVAPVGAVAVFAPWLRKAGSVCAEVSPPTLAALFAVQSGFRWGPNAPVSRRGALGPGQFLPGEWINYGDDADGDGKIDVFSVADATMASGHFMCDLYQQVETWKRDGVVHGDSLDLTLAAYTAGRDAVHHAGGMPVGRADLENETASHVHRIRSLEDSFERMLSPFFYGATGFGESRVVDVAMRFVGLPYVWGGGNINGPTMGGFDCSGLTSFAMFAATGIVLPRTSETQWHIGVEVPLSEAKPGDLLFGNWQEGGPGHVAIYVGNGQMLHAPTTGDVVRIGPVFDGMKARRIL